jgi:hypothetical protein
MTSWSKICVRPTKKKGQPSFQTLVKDMELYVNGESVPMNEFVENVIHDVMMALLTHLRDMDLPEINRIDIS